ncbi:interferon beta-like [Cynocephalus volans]|uniref:interferon beta-like n=1 Tax=Cynocephalus volans TaxID=110931 RepID=UPI002FC89D53
MNHWCILQIALLLGFSTTALPASYRSLRPQQSSSSLECLKLLWRLNGCPECCLKDRMNFEIPEEIKEPQQFQKEHATLVISEMLWNIFCIFRSNFSSTGWNETIVEHLLANLDWQMDHLEPFLKEKVKEKNFTLGNESNLSLKNYYSRIKQYLKTKDYSRCAWTVVRVEILSNFVIINRLTNYLQN